MPDAPVIESDSLPRSTRLSSRDEVLARYRSLRKISRHHYREAAKFTSRDAVMQQARRLGLARGKTLLLEDVDELGFAFDLAIYTAPADRSRAIDRYARAKPVAAGTDEMRVLDAMRAARFSIFRVERRHELAGLIVADLCRDVEDWLVDIGLESSVPDGTLLASRLYTPEGFSMTAGVNVPLDPGLVGNLDAELPPYLTDGPRAMIAGLPRRSIASPSPTRSWSGSGIRMCPMTALDHERR